MAIAYLRGTGQATMESGFGSPPPEHPYDGVSERISIRWRTLWLRWAEMNRNTLLGIAIHWCILQ